MLLGDGGSATPERGSENGWKCVVDIISPGIIIDGMNQHSNASVWMGIGSSPSICGIIVVQAG